MRVLYIIIIFVFMAISPRAAANAAAKTAATVAPATTWPYTLANAQAQGYTGWGSSSTPSLQMPTPTINRVISAPAAIESTYSIAWWAGSSGSSGYSGWIKQPTIVNATAGPYTLTNAQKQWSITPSVVSPAVKWAVQSYRNFFTSSGWDRATYNKSVGYDTLSTQQKRIADNVYNSTLSADKIKTGTVSLTALEETPEQEKDRLLIESKEAEKRDALLARDAALLAQNQAEQLQKAEADRATWELATEQTKYEWEQTETAAKTEENRLNQVRGDIMQSLAARWVDISKLAPEQMIALSGEQGVKAFNDIYVAKENAKNNIKAARDKSLAEIQRLRSNKNISTAAYNNQVASINELTNTKLRDADNAYKNAIVWLIDKKIDTKNIVVTGVMNALNTLGIPLEDQWAFKWLIASSKTPADAYTGIMTSTDPAIQAVYKKHKAAIDAAAANEYNLKVLQATPTVKTAAEQWLEYIKAADSIQSYNPVQAEALRTKGISLLSWTQTVVQPSTVP